MKCLGDIEVFTFMTDLTDGHVISTTEVVSARLTLSFFVLFVQRDTIATKTRLSALLSGNGMGFGSWVMGTVSVQSMYCYCISRGALYEWEFGCCFAVDGNRWADFCDHARVKEGALGLPSITPFFPF